MCGREGEERHMRSVPPVLGTTPTTVAASSNSATVVSTHFFFKDGRKIKVGDCALFKPPQDTPPPFIGIIRCLSSDREDGLWLGVNWLYRPSEVKLGKGSLLGAAPNEIFYSFHKDEIPAASLLHPCKVAFLRKGVELPSGISSFVCRRVYDTTNKCLWWLTDRDYTNERQEEVDQLLDKTRVEMHSQSGGRSPKSLNGPTSATQLKSASDSVLNNSTLSPFQVKGKKRERGDKGSEPRKQERYAKTADVDICHSTRSESMFKSEMDKLTNKGGLVDYEGVGKLVQLMQLDKTERKLDLASRIKLADVLASTDKDEFLEQFVQLSGLSVLNDWLQEVHKGKISDNPIIKESDKSVEDFLFTLLRALDKLPVNLQALQNCNVGKSVNNLRTHKNLEIQKKARSLVDTWKKRVEADMKIIDLKSASIQTISWPSKSGCPEVSQRGNGRAGSSSVVAMKSSVTQPSTYKTVSVKHGQGDGSARSSASPRSVKTASFPAPVAFSSKDLKEERSSGSSQSQNNSQSCTSEHIKTVASVWKEDARSSTAGTTTVNKPSSSSSRHRRSSNGSLAPVPGVEKDISSGKVGSLNRSSTSERVSQSGLTCERTPGIPVVDNGNSHRLIVRLANPGRNPAQSAAVCFRDNPSVMVTRISSPGPSEKDDQFDRKVKGKSDFRPNIAADVNAESWQSNDVKDGFAGSDEGEASPATLLDEEQCRSGDDIGSPMEVSRATCSSTRRDKGAFSKGPNSVRLGNANLSSITALVESCMKYSEDSTCIPAGDDGMNLLASVAAGEMSTSDLVSPVGSHGRNSSIQEDSQMGTYSKSRLPSDNVSVQSKGNSDDGAHTDTKKQVQIISAGFEGRLHVATSAGGSGSPSFSSEEKKTLGSSIIDLPQGDGPCSKSDGEPDERTGAVSPAVSTAGKDEEDACNEGANQLGDKRKMSATQTHGDDVQDLRPKVKHPMSDESLTLGNIDEKTAENNFTAASEFVHGSKLEGCNIDSKILNEKVENEAVEKSTSCPSLEVEGEIKKHVGEGFVGGFTIEQRLTPNGMNLTEAECEHGKNMTLPSCSGSVLNPDGLNELNSEKVVGGGARTHAEQRQTKYTGHACNVPLTSDGPVEAGHHNDGGAKDESERKEIFEKRTTGSLLHEELSTSRVEETEHCMNSSGSKVSGVEEDETEECASNAEPSSVSVGLEKATKFDFDLNESFPADDGSQGDSVSSAAPGCMSAVHLPSPLSYTVSSMTSSLTGLITVAAAKGSFLPPENLPRSTVELGWRGSAATSAFRPAEPRKVFELPLSATDSNLDTTVNKPGRLPLDIDLNEPDERVFEDLACQSSAQRIGSELGESSYRDLGRSVMFGSPTHEHTATELDLDLNRVDEDSDNGQLSATTVSTICRLEPPVFPVRSSSASVFLNDGRDATKYFDLNNGPGLDEVGSEPVRRGQHTKSSLSSLPHVADFRMSNAEFGTLSTWFPPCNSYPAVTIPTILPERGEQSYSFVATSGAQRFLGPVAGGTTLGPDVYRGPVFSSSPALPFSSPNSFPYPGFPFTSGVRVPSTTFSGASSTYLDSSSAGGLSFPAFPSQLVGPAGVVSAPYPRPYVFNVSDSPVNVGGADSSRKWGRQGLDLNNGPGASDIDVRDERFSSISWQLPVANSNTPLEEQMRLHQAASGVSKRKEPEGGWDTERFSYKKTSWQ